MKPLLFAAALCILPIAAHAQMSTDDLVGQLRLKPGGATRGIHAMPAATPEASAAATYAPRTGISKVANRVAVKPAAESATQGQANMTVQFETGSNKLTPAATRTLDVLGKALISPDLAADKFRIVGHTDTVGSPDTNQVLSEHRAAAVVAYLSERYKIDPARLTSVGMGQKELLVPTNPGVSSQDNRRVQVINLGT